MSMNFEIDLKKIEAAATREIVDAVCDSVDWNEVLTETINSRINKLFSEGADLAVSEAINRVMADGLASAYQPVNQFGEKTGDPTTIRERLAKTSTQYWNRKVDRKGRETDSMNTYTTRAEWMMVKICGDDFHKEVKQSMVNVTAGLKDGLRQELRGWIDSTLGDLFKVTSSQDKEEGRHR